MNKLIIIVIAVALIVGAAAFYGGMKYGQSKAQSAWGGQNFRNLSPAERQRFQESGVNGAVRLRPGAGGQGFIAGEIISQDDKSITIKLRDGGSKIIFLSEATEIGKFASSTVSELKIGETISINGKPNADGSVTADSIQIRSPLPAAD